MSDQGLLNWSAIRGTNTDFNNNSRATQGGCGFASDDSARPEAPRADAARAEEARSIPRRP
jgi:hypothetical protein